MRASADGAGRSIHTHGVMARLVPAIHGVVADRPFVDTRDKPGHDAGEGGGVSELRANQPSPTGSRRGRDDAGEG